MLKEKKIRALRLSLGHETSSKGNEFSFFCSSHGNPRNRPVGQLGVNVETGVFNCWSCGFKGHNLLPLLRKDLPERAEYAAELSEATKKKVDQYIIDLECVGKKFDVPVLPTEFRTLSFNWGTPDYKRAVSYLCSRGVRFSDILLMKLGYCETGKFSKRIIFPSFDRSGCLNFFVGRSFVGEVPKYKSGVFDKNIVFNDYIIDWTKPVTIVEGPFDALKAGVNSIPLQGCFLDVGSMLFSKIVQSGVDVYMALDTDAREKQVKLIETFIEYGVSCYDVKLRSKDVGDMTSEEFAEEKLSSPKIVTEFDLMRRRLS